MTDTERAEMVRAYPWVQRVCIRWLGRFFGQRFAWRLYREHSRETARLLALKEEE